MIKKTLDYKSKLTHSESAQKTGCNINHKCLYIVQLTGNQRQSKWEIAATLVFVCKVQ